MTLTINHNLMASSAARSLSKHYGSLGVSTRRLSSGLRVGTAADDAAGLAVRELMRSDIASNQQGLRNVNDAISMIQVADGALSVIDEKLIRMKELATQAATGTYNADQRQIINDEFQAMKMEIQRISEATDFNGTKLLDGSLKKVDNGSIQIDRGAIIHFGTGNDSAEDYYRVNADSSSINSLFGVYDGVDGNLIKSPFVAEGSATSINPVNHGTTADGGASAVSANDTAIETWTNGGAVYYRLFDSQGKPTTPETELSPAGDSNFRTSVTALDNGSFFVTWDGEGTSLGPDADPTGGIYGKIISDKGMASSTYHINSYTTNKQEMPRATQLDNGEIMITWTSDGQDGSNSGVYAQKIDVNGNFIGSEFQVNSNTSGFQYRSKITSLEGSNSVIAWQNSGRVAAKIFDANGNIIKDEFRVNNDTINNDERLQGVETLSNGNFLIYWNSIRADGTEYGTYGKIYSPNGEVIKNDFLMYEPDSSARAHPVIAVDNASFTLIYETETTSPLNTYALIFNNDGDIISNPLKIANTQDEFIGSANYLSDGRLRTTSTANYIWGYHSEIYQSPTDNILTDEEQINVTTQQNAQEMLDFISTAIIKKDQIRANLGATQNRLENTATNISIQAENLQAAESRISDVDVATEMTEFTREQILTQAATAMLAQANSLQRTILKLIEG